MTEYALIGRGDDQVFQTNFTLGDREYGICIPHDLAVYWRVNSTYQTHDSGEFYNFASIKLKTHLDIFYSRTGGFVNAFTKLNMSSAANEPSGVQFALLRHLTSKL